MNKLPSSVRPLSPALASLVPPLIPLHSLQYSLRRVRDDGDLRSRRWLRHRRARSGFHQRGVSRHRRLDCCTPHQRLWAEKENAFKISVCMGYSYEILQRTEIQSDICEHSDMLRLKPSI